CQDDCTVSDIIAVATGTAHTCIVFEGGTLRCWGDAAYGQIGSESTADIGDAPGEMPPAMVDLGGLSTKLALGANHSCVVRDNGQGRCWGRNDYGQLGIENINNIGDGNEMPPAAVADIYPFTAIAAGERNTCGIDDVGGVRCWGYGAYGMIGAGNNN